MYKVKLQLDAEVEAAYGLDKMAGWRKEEEAWLNLVVELEPKLLGRTFSGQLVRKEKVLWLRFIR